MNQKHVVTVEDITNIVLEERRPGCKKGLLHEDAPVLTAVYRVQPGSAGDAGEIMNRLNEADRERAWVEITEQFKQYEGPNGFEVPGEVLVGVGTK